MQFRQLKIQAKLMVIFGAIIFIGVLITGWTVWAISNLDQLTLELETAEFELSQAMQARNLVKEMELAELSFVVTEDEKFLHEHERYHAGVELYLRNALIRTEDTVISTILLQIKNELDGYDEKVAEIGDLIRHDEHARAEELGLESADQIEGMLIEIDKIIDTLVPRLAEKEAQSEQQVAMSGIVGAVVLVIFLILAIGAGGVVNRQVSAPLRTLMQATVDIRDDSFDPAVVDQMAGREDEIGQLARAFLRMFRDVESRRAALLTEREQLTQKLAELRSE